MSSTRPYDAVLCDMDGVLRTWDAAAVTEMERRYGVPEGTLYATAFAPELLQAAVTGKVTDDEWRRGVAAALLPGYGIDVATDLVADWSEPRGRVDEDVLALLTRARRAGLRVGVASNGSTRLESDLDALGLTDQVDVVVNSARLGVAKPDPVYYFAAAKLIDTEVERCLFVDDSPIHVDVARAVGMSAHLYQGVAGLRDVLAPVL